MMRTSHILKALTVALSLSASGLSPANALAASAGHLQYTAPALAGAETDTAPIEFTQVAEGCGWGRWRGPWGGCRGTPYYGPMPGGGWGYGRWWWHGGNGCPPGYWRGPWGHCRDTPYHGRLPGGGWK